MVPSPLLPLPRLQVSRGAGKSANPIYYAGCDVNLVKTGCPRSVARIVTAGASCCLAIPPPPPPPPAQSSRLSHCHLLSHCHTVTGFAPHAPPSIAAPPPPARQPLPDGHMPCAAPIAVLPKKTWHTSFFNAPSTPPSAPTSQTYSRPQFPPHRPGWPSQPAPALRSTSPNAMNSTHTPFSQHPVP